MNFQSGPTGVGGRNTNPVLLKFLNTVYDKEYYDYKMNNVLSILYIYTFIPVCYCSWHYHSTSMSPSEVLDLLESRTDGFKIIGMAADKSYVYWTLSYNNLIFNIQ